MSTVAGYRELLTKYAPQPIRSQEAYEQALAQLEKLMVPRPNAARSLLIEMLATLIEKYESRAYPTPEVAPSDMLAKLVKTKGVKPADVAKKTGIPTATLSNVLARRRGISKQNAFKLGEYFGLSPIVFLGRQPQKKRLSDEVCEHLGSPSPTTSARASYVRGSAESDREAVFLTQDTPEETVILRWELREPLPPLKDGVVRFQARVR